MRFSPFQHRRPGPPHYKMVIRKNSLMVIYASAIWICLVAGGGYDSTRGLRWGYQYLPVRHYASVKVMMPYYYHHYQHQLTDDNRLDFPAATGVINYYDKRSHDIHDTLSASISVARQQRPIHHRHPSTTTTLMGPESFFGIVKDQSCFCVSKPKQIDLGPLRSPRYLTSMECSPGTCGQNPHSCEGTTIKIWVLKQREPTDIEDIHVPLPPRDLRDNYIFEGIVVTAACGCSRIENI